MQDDQKNQQSNLLYKRIIPCLDVNGGRVVKGVNFVGLRDAGDPVEIAKRYSEQGADELTFLDITATTEERDLILPIIQQTAAAISIPLIVGGGIRELNDIQRLLDVGAAKVSIGSAAIANPELIQEAAQHFGSERLLVAIDARRVSTENEAPRWEVYSHGGTKGTGIDAVEWARKMAANGAGELLVTSMDRDGTKNGFDLELTRAISDAVDVPVIASGGVGSLQHMADGVTLGGASAVLAASIFHFGDFTIGECKQFMQEQGIPVRVVQMQWITQVNFNDQGLIPVIAQDWQTDRVLMVAWMNHEALVETVGTMRGVYWSRSRKKLWRKGESSGHTQIVHKILLDCDADVILLKVEQTGGVACHTGRESCFYKSLELDAQGELSWEEVDPVLIDPATLYQSEE